MEKQNKGVQTGMRSVLHSFNSELNNISNEEAKKEEKKRISVPPRLTNIVLSPLLLFPFMGRGEQSHSGSIRNLKGRGIGAL